MFHRLLVTITFVLSVCLYANVSHSKISRQCLPATELQRFEDLPVGNWEFTWTRPTGEVLSFKSDIVPVYRHYVFIALFDGGKKFASGLHWVNDQGTHVFALNVWQNGNWAWKQLKGMPTSFAAEDVNGKYEFKRVGEATEPAPFTVRLTEPNVNVGVLRFSSRLFIGELETKFGFGSVTHSSMPGYVYLMSYAKTPTHEQIGIKTVKIGEQSEMLIATPRVPVDNLHLGHCFWFRAPVTLTEDFHTKPILLVDEEKTHSSAVIIP